MTSTHDVTGRQLPLVIEPTKELGDDWLHNTGPHLPRLTITTAAQYSWKNMGMLAAVANCGRSRKWCDRGRLALGFKPRHGSHVVSFWDHSASAEKNHRLLFPFLRYGTLDWAEGGRKDCVFVGILKTLGSQ